MSEYNDQRNPNTFLGAMRGASPVAVVPNGCVKWAGQDPMNDFRCAVEWSPPKKWAGNRTGE